MKPDKWGMTLDIIDSMLRLCLHSSALGKVFIDIDSIDVNIYMGIHTHIYSRTIVIKAAGY